MGGSSAAGPDRLTVGCHHGEGQHGGRESTRPPEVYGFWR